jgi:uncharacterized RDD family membrane protein YckC
MSVYCLECGAKIPAVSRYCKSCGANQYPDETSALFSPQPSLSACLTVENDIATDPEANKLPPMDTTGVPPPPQPVPDLGNATEINADLGVRLLAYIADLVIVCFIYLCLVFTVALGETLSSSPSSYSNYLIESSVISFYLIFIAYMIAALSIYHSTIGKYLFKLKVLSSKDGEKYPTFARILLRETLGRIGSSLFWGIGYWTAGRYNNRAWSDRIADTKVVVHEHTHTILRRTIIAIVATAMVADLSAIAYGQYKDDQKKKREAIMSSFEKESNALKKSNGEIRRLQDENTNDLTEYKSNLESLLSEVEAYEQHITACKSMAEKIVSEKLYSSESERDQFTALLKVYELRSKQVGILRSEVNIGLKVPFEESGRMRKDELAEMRDMESDLTGLDSQADKILTDAKLK